MNIVCHFYLFVKRDPFPQVQAKIELVNFVPADQLVWQTLISRLLHSKMLITQAFYEKGVFIALFQAATLQPGIVG